MTIQTIPAKGGWFESRWSFPRHLRFRVLTVMGVDEAGGFHVYAADLPGVVSQGDTEAEAMGNFCEAFRGVVASYLANGPRIPWLDSPMAPAENKSTRLVEIDVENPKPQES